MGDWKPVDGSQRSEERQRRVGPRPRVIGGKELLARVQAARRADREAIAEYDHDERPRVRADCQGGMRPCPWVGCRHHLYLSIGETNRAGDAAGIVLAFPEKEPWELAETCALDVAERGGITLEEVGELTNLTRERIRQIEGRALYSMKRRAEQLGDE